MINFCHRSFMSKNKVTSYFIPASIENNLKETRDRNITIIENQPQKNPADPIIEGDKLFHPPTDFCFFKTKSGEIQHSCQSQ